MSHVEEQKLHTAEETPQAAVLGSPEQLQQAELSAEELLKKVEEKNGKILPFNRLDADTNSQFIAALTELAALRDELMTKVIEARQHNEVIKSRVDQLVEAKKIHVNSEHYNHFDQSITTYVNLLLNISQELEAELIHFVPYTTETPPPVIMVHKDDVDDTTLYFIQKIRWIKRHVKTIRKDLMVSFSRYSFGFDSQMKQLDAIEAYMQKTV